MWKKEDKVGEKLAKMTPEHNKFLNKYLYEDLDILDLFRAISSITCLRYPLQMGLGPFSTIWTLDLKITQIARLENFTHLSPALIHVKHA